MQFPHFESTIANILAMTVVAMLVGAVANLVVELGFALVDGKKRVRRR